MRYRCSQAVGAGPSRLVRVAEEAAAGAIAGLPLVERGNVQFPEFAKMLLGGPRDTEETDEVDIAADIVTVWARVDVTREVVVVV